VISASNATTPPPAMQTTINPPLSNFLPLSTGGTAFGSPGTLLNTGIGVDRLSFQSDLQIHAVDVEATYSWQGAAWSLVASAGGRYLTLNQGYHAMLFNAGGGLPVSELQQFDATRSFIGGGPVAGIFGTLQLGCTGLSLYANLRGAFAVGHSGESVRFVQVVNDPAGLIPPGVPGTLVLVPTASRSIDHVVSVAEVELGVQYEFSLWRSLVFFRAGAVNQTYFDAGNASQPTGNLSLFGLLLSAGMRY
jgi:hypothetical protein